MKKYKTFALILGLTIVIFVFLFYKIPVRDVFHIIKQADLRIIVLTFGISIVSNILISSYRWKLILRRLKCPVSWKECLLIKMGSDSIISSLPLRMGEASRVLYLQRVRNIPYPKSILSILCEYSLNILALLFFILMGAFGFWVAGNDVMAGQNFLFAPVLFNNIRLNKEINVLNNKWKNFFHKYLKGHLKDFKTVFFSRGIVLCTAVLGASELVNVYLISKAVDISIPFYAILLYVPLIVLIGSIPVTFLGVGLRESAVLFFFFRFTSPEKVLSLGILYSFIEHLVPMIIGLSLTGLFMHKLLFRRNI